MWDGKAHPTHARTGTRKWPPTELCVTNRPRRSALHSERHPRSLNGRVYRPPYPADDPDAVWDHGGVVFDHAVRARRAGGIADCTDEQRAERGDVDHHRFRPRGWAAGR